MGVANMDESNSPLVGLLTFYEKANFVLRIALLITVLWPFSVIGTAMVLKPATAQTVVPIVDLVPLAAVFFLILGAPFGLLALLRNPTAKKGLTWLAALIGVELTIGVYFSTVPVSKDIGLVPLLVLTSLAIFFLRIGGIAGILTKALALLVIAITSIFIFGGRKRVEKQVESALNASRSTPISNSIPHIPISNSPQRIPVRNSPRHVPVIEVPPHRLLLRQPVETAPSNPVPVAPEVSRSPTPNAGLVPPAGSITSGPVVVNQGVDNFDFGFWSCRRTAGAVQCAGFVRNEYTAVEYLSLNLSDVKDGLGNEYQAQKYTVSGKNCYGPWTPCRLQLNPEASAPIRITVEGIVSQTKSCILYFRVVRPGPYGYSASNPGTDFSIIVPIETTP